MRLSIIVPVYNMVAGGKLDFCLQSLMNQELTDFEVIAVDDKSTDQSLMVLKKWEGEYPERLKVIASDENRKQGGAKNLGLAVACGDYIGFVDSDDWVAPTMYKKLLDKAYETGADCVGCDYSMVTEHTMKVGQYVINNGVGQIGIVSKERQKQMILNSGSMVVKIYKRDLFFEQNIKFPEHIFYEDNAIGAMVILQAKNFQKVEEALYYYYQNPNSTVHTTTRKKCEDRMSAGLIALEKYKEAGFYEEFKDEIDYKFFELYYKNTLFSYLQSCKERKLSFVKKIREGFLSEVVDIEKNPYYQKLTDTENKKLIHMHFKSNFLFFNYYKLLYFYRRLRYGGRSE